MAINKIDLVGYRRGRLRQIAGDYAAFAAQLGFRSIVTIPISARFGDNVTGPSANMPWYRGPTLLDYLETVDVAAKARRDRSAFRCSGSIDPISISAVMPERWCRGAIKVGDPVVVAGSGQKSRVKELLTYEGALASAQSGDAITMTLDGRDRHCPRRSTGRCHFAAGGLGSIRGAFDLDERGTAGAGTLLSVPGWTDDCRRSR